MQTHIPQVQASGFQLFPQLLPPSRGQGTQVPRNLWQSFLLPFQALSILPIQGLLFFWLNSKSKTHILSWGKLAQCHPHSLSY